MKLPTFGGNRLIGDEQLPDDGVKDGKWPDWLLENKPRTSGRFTFTPRHFYDKNSPLQESGLLGAGNDSNSNKII